LAPYTTLKRLEVDYNDGVLNLILDGWLLIHEDSAHSSVYSLRSFKPYFRWLAPYTNKQAIYILDKNSFKPYFRWLAPYTLVF
jgi:hypothetical protein